MGDSRYSRTYERRSRSRSRSPFRKNFSERGAGGGNEAKRMRRDSGHDKSKRSRLFVNNIPFECRWMELKDLFREKVGDVTFVELFEDSKGKFNGTGVIEFKDEQTAQKAIDIMHKFEFKGRQLNVKLDTEPDKGRGGRGGPLPPPPRGMDRDRRDRNFGDSFRSEPGYSTYGLNPDFLASLNIKGPLTTKIFISNLDYKVTEKKLEEIFKLAGKLVNMELNTDAEGKSKGYAVGEYEHPLEAVQAISMFNGQKLFTRLLNVRMDKYADDEPASKLPTGLHSIGKGLGINGQPMSFARAAAVSNGGYNFGLGIGASGGGMGVGGNMGMVSNSGLGMSPGMNNPLAADRSMMGASSMGMGLVGSNMGTSSLAGGMGMMGSSGGMMSSSMDNVNRRDGFPLSPSTAGRGFRDNFDRNHDFPTNVTDTLILGNLPSSFTWQLFKDRFRDIGDIRYAEMKGQGTAMIRFGSLQDAQRAYSMINGVRFDGRTADVRFY